MAVTCPMPESVLMLCTEEREEWLLGGVVMWVGCRVPVGIWEVLRLRPDGVEVGVAMWEVLPEGMAVGEGMCEVLRLRPCPEGT